jgi:hypothetical protein
MLRRSLMIALPALGVSACAGLAPVETASLPRNFVDGAGDPTRAAAISAGSAFGNPRQLAGQPGRAARAIAQMEYLAVELPSSPMLRNQAGTLQPELQAARREWRGALGVAPNAPAQRVINGLLAASQAIEDGRQDALRAALTSDVFTAGAEGTVARLGALPPLPRTAQAAASAERSLLTPQRSTRPSVL